MGEVIRVGDVMKERVLTIHCQKTVSEAEDFLVANEISGAPMVATDGQIMGVVSKTDIARFRSESRTGDPRVQMVYEIGSPIPITVEVVSCVRKAARIMAEKRVHRLIVVKGGVPVGILTTLDIAQLFADS